MYKAARDRFLEEQIWHLGLVVFQHRKATKAWSIRYDLLKELSKVRRFLRDPKIYEDADNIFEDEEAIKSEVATSDEKDFGYL